VEEWTFGSYQVKALIGRGGMGEVYRAYDTSHDRMVALKLLAAHLSADESYRARFRRECHLAARLREPHVIPIHSYGETDGRLFLDMRLVEGRDLGDVLTTTGAPSPRRAVDIISQVARALDAAHDDGLIHRDVKPSNVLIAEEDAADSDFVFVYLVDFGVARALGDDRHSNALTQTGGAVGTFDYMPPERFAGLEADRHTDVYSLTCMLYETLTGERPFPGTDLPTLMYSHMNQLPPAPSRRVAGLTEAMDAVIARGMAKDPTARFDSAGAMAAAARAALRAAGGDVQGLDSRPAPSHLQARPSEARTAWPQSPAAAPATAGPSSAAPIAAPFSNVWSEPTLRTDRTPPPVSSPGSAPMPYPSPGPFSQPGNPGPVSHPSQPGPGYPVSHPSQPGFGGPVSFAGVGGAPPPYGPPTPLPNTPLPTNQPPRPPISSPGSPPPYGGPPDRPGPPGSGGGRRRAQPDRSRRRVLIIAAVVVVALIGALIAVFATRTSNSGSPGPTTTPTSSPAGPSFSISTSAAPQLDAQLVDHLPASIDKSTCRVDSIEDTEAVAGILCGQSTAANGPTISEFFRYPSRAALDHDFKNVISNNKLKANPSACPGLGYDNYSYKVTPKSPAGQLAAYTKTNQAVVSWSEYRTLTLGFAFSYATSQLAGLCSWWAAGV
jgi:serine/threonine-protein kinase